MERLIPPNAKVFRSGDHIVMLFDRITVNVSPRMACRLAYRLLKLSAQIMHGNEPPK